jgi:hypothetical protein
VQANVPQDFSKGSFACLVVFRQSSPKVLSASPFAFFAKMKLLISSSADAIDFTEIRLLCGSLESPF